MEIIIIAAVAENNVIGKDNAIPWRISEDFRHFKTLTMGHPCIMGRKTYESLPPNFRPLPGRENIVLSSDKNYHQEGATVFGSLEEAIGYCRNKNEEKVFVIGGASVYNAAMKLADVLEITKVHKSFEGDTFFPEIKSDEWKIIGNEDFEGKDLKNDSVVKFSFVRYTRKN
ncbi:MAG: dihydrofolate reductase [Candidatus Micrarchaeota archaeon]|nr:dihydrofolate reductase [Candidatus Micrarchaeota archaeon]